METEDDTGLLIGRVAAGDRSAFKKLYDARAKVLLAMCEQAYTDSATADAWFIAGFEAVWRRTSEFEAQEGSATEWMLGCFADLPTNVDQSDQKVLECFEKLAADQKDALVMAKEETSSYEDIALTLKIPVGDVRPWFRNGLSALEACVNKDGEPRDEQVQEANLLAAESALGLLTQSERAAFDAVAEVDSSLREQKETWRAILAQLPAPAERVEALWYRICERLPEATDLDVQTGQPNAAQTDTGSEPQKRRLWSRIGLVPYAAFGLVMALLVLSFVDLRMEPERPQPDYGVALREAEGGISVDVGYTGESGVLAIRHISGSAPSGKALELWLMPSGSDTPISLGVVGNREGESIVIPAELRASIAGGQVILTEERLGGSISKRPTGQTIASGVLVQAD